MAIFIPPRITTAVRSTLVLKAGEIVYDTTNGNFYKGDGTTVGGLIIASGDGISESMRNIAGGFAGLDSGARVAAAQMPSSYAVLAQHPTDSGAHSSAFDHSIKIQGGTHLTNTAYQLLEPGTDITTRPSGDVYYSLVCAQLANGKMLAELGGKRQADGTNFVYIKVGSVTGAEYNIVFSITANDARAISGGWHLQDFTCETPTANYSVANKQYVDNTVAGGIAAALGGTVALGGTLSVVGGTATVTGDGEVFARSGTLGVYDDRVATLKNLYAYANGGYNASGCSGWVIIENTVVAFGHVSHTAGNGQSQRFAFGISFTGKNVAVMTPVVTSVTSGLSADLSLYAQADSSGFDLTVYGNGGTVGVDYIAILR